MSTDLDRELSSIFSQLTSHINKDSLQSEVKEILLNKRRRQQNELGYMKNLVENIAFITESYKATEELLEKIFAEKIFTPVQTAVENIVGSMQSDIKQAMPRLLPVYSQLIKENKSNQENISFLEMNYSVSKLSQDFTNSFLITMCNPANKSFFANLFNYPPRILVDNIRQQSQFYAAMFCDGVSFG
ncbi:hypothetical protein [Paenibacillus ferrarius]|uniref:hypothetical protein n=1 Tax=Paenibacillus ferrarius TaxID=1469647 RepID=UPI003D2CC90C